MYKKDFDALRPGLYTICWSGANGGSSLAAIGILPNGSRWIAPCDQELPDVNSVSYKDIHTAILMHTKLPVPKNPREAFSFSRSRGIGTYEFLEAKNKHLYRRSHAGNWEKMMGEYWVPVENFKTIEQAFRQFTKDPLWRSKQ